LTSGSERKPDPSQQPGSATDQGVRQFPRWRCPARAVPRVPRVLRQVPQQEAAASTAGPTVPVEQESPDDLIAPAEADTRIVLAGDLLEKVRAIEATAFQRLVLKLLEAMGYGGLGLMRHTGKTSDGGVEGVIEEDKLGLNRIYVQAKRYQAGNTVGSVEMRNFLGAMSGKVDRGMFLTTSTFTQAAERKLEGRGVRVVLIKGDEVVDLMIEHGVGVEPIKVATIHRINEEFFDEL
jgi:restriction system protein